MITFYISHILENYAELWNKTVQQIPAQDQHITAVRDVSTTQFKLLAGSSKLLADLSNVSPP